MSLLVSINAYSTDILPGQTYPGGTSSASSIGSDDGSKALVLRSVSGDLLARNAVPSGSAVITDLTKVPGIAGPVNSWIMQGDGDFVGRNASGQIWVHSNTGNKPGSYLRFENDGRLKMISPTPKPVWATNTATTNFAHSINPAIGTWVSGRNLRSGNHISSGNGTYRLIMQVDGNLVLYNYVEGRPLWASNTFGTGNWATMSNDGNMAVYSSANVLKWSSKTSGRPTSYASIQDDGNMVIYTPYTKAWSTKTSAASYQISESGSGIIPSGKLMYAGDSVWSGNRTYALIMQTDGNLVLYNAAKGIPLWASNTFGQGNWAAMQTDGNLVVYSSSHAPLYATGTQLKPSSIGAVQDNGNFVIYTPNTKVSFESAPVPASGTSGQVSTLTPSNPAPGSYYMMCPDGSVVRGDQQCPVNGTYGPITCSVNSDFAVHCGN